MGTNLLFVSVIFAIASQNRCSALRDVSPENYPYHAWVRGTGTFWCSGTLISKNYLITNGLCVNGSADVTVYLGFKKAPYTTAGQQEAGTLKIDSTEITVHEDYVQVVPNRYYNNIALIKFPKPILFSYKIQPALLSTKRKNQLLSGKTGDVCTCHIAFGPNYFPDQELCGKWLDGSLLGNGSPVNVNGKIVGQTTDRGTCPTRGFKCGTYLIVLNFAEFLDWISWHTNISVSQLTGEEPDCSRNELVCPSQSCTSTCSK